MPRSRPAPLISRLPARMIAKWLQAHPDVDPAAVRSGRSPWTVAAIEEEIARVDPAAWCRLNFVLQYPLRDEDTGLVVIEAGSPYVLFTAQARLARARGDLVVECGSGVGKTADIALGVARAASLTTCALLVACNSLSTASQIFAMLVFQMEGNPLIGGGIRKKRENPHEIQLNNGSVIYLRTVGRTGESVKGLHVEGVWGDECSSWQTVDAFSNVIARAKAGASVRLYSMPVANWKTPFAAICAKAVPIDGRTDTMETAEGMLDVPLARGFKKVRIAKTDLPPPLWTPAREEKLLALYGGRHTTAWLNNVEGKWASPQFSFLTMETLGPNLKYLPHYRAVVAVVGSGDVDLSVSRLSRDVELVAGSAQEEILTRGREIFASADALGRRIAEMYPSTASRDWVDPAIFCGGDLGVKEPTELLFGRHVGDKVIDVFRLHIRGAGYTMQEKVLCYLDHASDHRVRYALDAGNAGGAVVSHLTELSEYQLCPVCEKETLFRERIRAVGFGEKNDDFDLTTGAFVLNEDDKNADGKPRPFRLSNKEWSSRLIERAAFGKHLEMADDGGAGNPDLGSVALLLGHTVESISNKNERRFRGIDDHSVDARRLLMMAVALAGKAPDRPYVPANEAVLRSIPRGSAGSGLWDGVGRLDAPGSISRSFARGGGFSGEGGW